MLTATPVDTTQIASNAANTNYSTDPIIYAARNASTVTRTSFWQFTLPAITAGYIIDSVTLTLHSGAQTTSNQTLLLAGFSDNPNISTLTWNTAVSGDYITGTIDGSSFQTSYDTKATPFSSEIWTIPPIDAGFVATYTDSTSASGLLNYISSKASYAGPVTITLGTMGSSTVAGDSNFALQTDNFAIAGREPTLTMNLSPIPEPTTLLATLGGLLLVLVITRKRARYLQS